ncbi:MAG: UDP-N-acetylmuramoyl-tripeptide--D-alanyl-D-alanine ligase [Verrucomicrobia bacterium]|nr:UDP-N-acetylmuramoyl-tripeptide--D-alanyl-D-alanine ligase [Verrucomicrobiota bacterium]
MKNKPLKEIAHILNIRIEQSKPALQFAIDSRKIERQGVFFALPGAKADGHFFLKEVAEKGALGAIVSKHYSGPSFGLELIKVPDVFQALHTLAKTAFNERKEKVIGVTGSMGKTTSKEFVATLLAAKYRVAKSPDSYNSQLTLPLTLLNLEGEYDVLVLEMAMSNPGEIKTLVSIAPPDLALLTRIAPAGMTDFRGGLEAIAHAKAEIFSHPRTRFGVISCQAAKFKQVLYGGGVPKWIYGWKKDFEDPKMGDFIMEESGEDVVINDSPPIALGFEARHLRENFLAAATVAKAMGLTWSEIRQQAPLLKPFKHRFEKIERDGITFIQDCYNANPESILAALKNLPKAKGKTIGVLGAMPDLGDQSAHFHLQVGNVASEYLDRLLCIGEDAKNYAASFAKDAKHFSQLAEIKKELFALAEPGDVVLIKGGNGFKLWQLLEE